MRPVANLRDNIDNRFRSIVIFGIFLVIKPNWNKKWNWLRAYGGVFVGWFACLWADESTWHRHSVTETVPFLSFWRQISDVLRSFRTRKDGFWHKWCPGVAAGPNMRANVSKRGDNQMANIWMDHVTDCHNLDRLGGVLPKIVLTLCYRTFECAKMKKNKILNSKCLDGIFPLFSTFSPFSIFVFGQRRLQCVNHNMHENSFTLKCTRINQKTA